MLLNKSVAILRDRILDIDSKKLRDEINEMNEKLRKGIDEIVNRVKAAKSLMAQFSTMELK